MFSNEQYARNCVAAYAYDFNEYTGTELPPPSNGIRGACLGWCIKILKISKIITINWRSL